MTEVTTYVGVDAHKKDLFVAMLIGHADDTLLELDARLTAIAEAEPYRQRVGWLRCFRGIDTLDRDPGAGRVA